MTLGCSGRMKSWESPPLSSLLLTQAIQLQVSTKLLTVSKSHDISSFIEDKQISITTYCTKQMQNNYSTCAINYHSNTANLHIMNYHTYRLIMRPSSLGGAAYCVALCLSVCPSVCPSILCLFTLEHRSRVFVNLADVWYLLFCLHARAAYSMAISAAQACFFMSHLVSRYKQMLN